MEKAITLYHGTSFQHWQSIKKNGLLPRGQLDTDGNWEGDVISKPELVYLTTAYPVYFALQAAGEDHNLLVLEVEVEVEDLYPDEDFIAYALKQKPFADLPLAEVIKHIHPFDFKELATRSLEYNGVVSTKRIPPERIINHCVLEMTKHVRPIMWLGGDSMPIPLNYQILGKQYCKYMKIMLRDGVDAAFKEAQKDHREKFACLDEPNNA